MILKHRSSPSIRQNKLKQCYDDIGINIEINVKAVSIHQHSQNAMKSKLFAIGVCALFCNSSFAADHYWRTPVWSTINDSPVRVFSPGDSMTSHGVYAFDMPTTNVFTPHANWNVGDYTGLQTGAPLQKYQASFNPNASGATAVQLKDDSFGLILHTWTMTLHPGQNVAAVQWGGPLNATPWGAQFGTNPHFCFSHRQTVPRSEAYSVVQHTYTSLFLYDAVTQQTIPMMVTSWANIGVPLEYVAPDTNTNSAGNVGYYAASYYGNNTRYVTKMNWSSDQGNALFSQEKFFAACITKGNLQNIINDLNAKRPSSYPKYSSNFENYTVQGMGIQAETGALDKSNLTDPYHQGWFSMTARDAWIYTNY
ncbi:hypothetical protein [Delftia acidovorans]|uniref:hypothetical protein n=1 Tax=Delftia acidovorans TaxID=80866 RepID=UPI00192CDDB6|nr:hypothetical protein [Delftia acidovorans]